MERHCHQEHFIFMQHVWSDELKFLNTSLRKTHLIEKLGRKKLGEGKGSRYHIEKHVWKSAGKRPHCQSAGELGPLIIQMVPKLQWFDLEFFNFMMVQKQQAFSRNCTSNFES